MPTGFEEITLGYKIANLALEIGRFSANKFKERGSNSKHRFISSLTTMEFSQENGSIVAHYVQDRTVKITGHDARLPYFSFGTAGLDTPLEITVSLGSSTSKFRPRVVEEKGHQKIVGIDAERVYEKGAIIRSVFTAISHNGFPASEENFRVIVTQPPEPASRL